MLCKRTSVEDDEVDQEVTMDIPMQSEMPNLCEHLTSKMELAVGYSVLLYTRSGL